MDTEDELRTHIEHLLSCKVVKYLGQTEIKEEFEGQTIWEGIVHTYNVDHPDTDTCYAWSSPIEGSDKNKIYAVLHIPPVDSPQKAVRASIISDYRNEVSNQ